MHILLAELIEELEKARTEKKDWSDWDYANGYRDGIDTAIEIIKKRKYRKREE